MRPVARADLPSSFTAWMRTFFRPEGPRRKIRTPSPRQLAPVQDSPTPYLRLTKSSLPRHHSRRLPTGLVLCLADSSDLCPHRAPSSGALSCNNPYPRFPAEMTYNHLIHFHSRLQQLFIHVKPFSLALFLGSPCGPGRLFIFAHTLQF